ncbi:kinase-like domain-containing protein [Sphaerosporella brunnea]|uniref:Kinase-like domain-containing protein n=1 Tax=Sphaerosporella brunnea TaxID=1250544 RepID=A0A5J5EQL4_9PEZI|nr:kinase-like domain-containing protein [Sphaerosporella brunnea]
MVKVSKVLIKSIGSTWELGMLLGKGSGGVVRLVKHIRTGQLAAAKMVPKLQQMKETDSPLTDQEGIVAREIAVLKLLDHPNLIKLLDIYEDEFEFCLIMEYCPNGELFQVLSNWGPLNETEAVPMFRQILSAVYYCQMINIAHRDLKPENILLGRNNVIKVSDFGLSAISPKKIPISGTCGSPHYAAPELVEGRSYDGRMVDIWSLGVVLYVMISAASPYGNISQTNISGLLKKVRRADIVMQPFFSPAAKDLLWKMLQIDPNKRIKMSDIWKHPFVKGDSPNQGLRPDASLLVRVSMLDVPKPLLAEGDEVDKETMNNLLALHPGLTAEYMIKQLKARS